MTQAPLEALRPTLSAIEAVDVNAPEAPIAIIHQEANDLAALLRSPGVTERLTAVGLDLATVAALAPALEASRTAQSQWVIARDRSKPEAQRAREEEGERLRNMLAAACRWNLRGNSVAVSTVQSVTDGDGVADLVQDLFDLAALIDANRGAFTSDTTFNPAEQSEKARMIGSNVKEGLSVTRVDMTRLQAKDLRDRAATYLSSVVSEIREAGRYVYRNEPATQVRFMSAYDRFVRHRAANRVVRAAASATTA